MSDLERAAAILRGGGLVAFPTETVYGLGADASNVDALRRLYAVKRRPASHPVIVHIADGANLDDYAVDIPDVARELARAFWPGPLTLVVKRRPDHIAAEATGGLATVGLRVPAHPLAQELLAVFGGGVAAPSANRFGRVSPTTAEHVRADLGSDVDLVIDGGPCRIGVESTIVEVTGAEPIVLRIGGITDSQLAAVCGRTPARDTTGRVAAPGTLAAHYAPRAAVEIAEMQQVAARAFDLARAGAAVAVLALTPPTGLPPDAVVLTPPADVDDYARVLYARLRDADRHGVDVVLVVPPPPGGLGDAINDRLLRAARSNFEGT